MATPIFLPGDLDKYRSKKPALFGVSGTGADQVSRKGLGFGAKPPFPFLCLAAASYAAGAGRFRRLLLWYEAVNARITRKDI